MGRVVLGLLALLLTTGCATSTPAPSEADPTSPTTARAATRVLFAGDSLADGYYASAPSLAFPDLLLARWRQEGQVTDLRAVHAGWRTWRIATLVDQTDLDLAVLEAGANDVGETPVGEFARDYTRLIAEVESGSPGVRMLCLGPWGSPRETAPYNRVVRRLCDEGERTFARLSDLYDNPGMRGPAGTATPLGERDDYHPNDRGHAAIAERVRAVIASMTTSAVG